MTPHFRRIDHLAIAVRNLEDAVAFYVGTLGMTLVERRETTGKHTGMLSAVLDAGTFKIVLMEGVGEQSQVCRFIENFGQGVQHVAFEVDDVERTAESLAHAGMQFSTRLLVGPGLTGSSARGGSSWRREAGARPTSRSGEISVDSRIPA